MNLLFFCMEGFALYPHLYRRKGREFETSGYEATGSILYGTCNC